MRNSKLIYLRLLFLLICFFSSTGAIANDAIKLSDGINVNTRYLKLGDQFRIDFTLRETQNAPVSSVHVQLFMRNLRGVRDILVRDFGLVDFEAGETRRLGTEYSLVADLELPDGLYGLAVGYVAPNGRLTFFEEEDGTENRIRLDVTRKLLGFEGYIYGRTDKREFRWIGRLPNGEFGHTWIDEQCAQLLGAANQTGDWYQLRFLAPAGIQVIDNPCSAGLVQANNVKLYSGIYITPPDPKVGERFEVFFDLRETQDRPVTFSNVQVSLESADSSAIVDLGEIKIDPRIASRFSAEFDSNYQLEAGTYQAAVRYQLLGGAPTKFEELDDDASNPITFQIQGTAPNAEGYVFARTDSSELRWLAPAPGGRFGHTWIDEQCAESLGGISRRGTWDELNALALAGDKSIPNPCETAVQEAPDNLFVNDGEGYVFSRSDSYEFRWIGRTPTGEFGHTWISGECATALGGAGVAGDWQYLTSLAPAGDQTVTNPCDSINSFLQGGEGYVFARSDSAELRWVGRSASGELGHTWIDEQCSESLGGVSARGDWQELRDRAPAGDMSVANPCK